MWYSIGWDGALCHPLGGFCTQREYKCHVLRSSAHLDALVNSRAKQLCKLSNVSGAGMGSSARTTLLLRP